jgi:hypothetical protein
MKCDGLDDTGLRQRSVPPSSPSLLGLVRHMTDVERSWFRRILISDGAAPPASGTASTTCRTARSVGLSARSLTWMPLVRDLGNAVCMAGRHRLRRVGYLVEGGIAYHVSRVL